MKKSAGLLMYRNATAGFIQVLLAHPGGPYWRGKDAGAWTLPKGEYQEPEQALDAARREFDEETGYPSQPPFLPLGEVTLKSGKRIAAWAFEGDGDPAQLRSNTFEIEWPSRSGRIQSFAELDRVQWFTLAEARLRINATQAAFIDRLEALLKPAR
jgi:predicted NUDIX family NTP pyrophosphohydrolase